MRLYVSCFSFALVAALFTPISAEAQVTDAFCTAVYDANGTRVARANGLGATTDIVLVDQGRAVRLQVKKDRIEGISRVFFTEDNCMGDALMHAGGVLEYAQLAGTDVWYPDTTVVPASVEARSQRNRDGVCTNSVGTLSAPVPALNFTLPTFTPPFHLEPEACFTPDDPDPEQIINGCIKNNGTIKIVDEPVDCSDRETPISWLGQ